MKYQTYVYKGTMEALAQPGKLADIKTKYESAAKANAELHNQAIEKCKQMKALAMDVFGSGSNTVKYLNGKYAPNPPNVMGEYTKLANDFRKWQIRQESNRQKKLREQQRREERERAQAEKRERQQDYRARSQESRAALESCGYVYGQDFFGNAITFAKKHIRFNEKTETWERIEPVYEPSMYDPTMFL